MTKRDSIPEEELQNPTEDAAEERSDAQESGESPRAAHGHVDLGTQLEELEDLIRESPLAAVGIAAGVGLVVGLLLNRR